MPAISTEQEASAHKASLYKVKGNWKQKRIKARTKRYPPVFPFKKLFWVLANQKKKKKIGYLARLVTEITLTPLMDSNKPAFSSQRFRFQVQAVIGGYRFSVVILLFGCITM